jgi:hypothetical protein
MQSCRVRVAGYDLRISLHARIVHDDCGDLDTSECSEKPIKAFWLIRCHDDGCHITRTWILVAKIWTLE